MLAGTSNALHAKETTWETRIWKFLMAILHMQLTAKVRSQFCLSVFLFSQDRSEVCFMY
jgi:hypothetical protein